MSGTPTLILLQIHTQFIDTIDATTTTNIPGSTITIDVLTRAMPAGGQTGVRSGSTIDWGALTGWTQTGRLRCEEHCPGGCGIWEGSARPGTRTAGFFADSCIPFVGFSGTGPPPPLNGTVFNSDPWIFTDYQHFTAPSVEFVNLSAGVVRAYTEVSGWLRAPIPAVSSLGLASMAVLLAGGMFYLSRRFGK